MPPRQGLPRRQVRQTALLVGEGLAEETFLRHLKSLYLARGDGRSVAIKNAKGKGGKHVLDYTLGQRKTADYDELAALLDTDTDWGDAQKAVARRNDVCVFEASPCLEALLLRIVGQAVPGVTRDCKQAFQRFSGSEAHDARVYPRFFTFEVLEQARKRVALLEQLISYITG